MEIKIALIQKLLSFRWMCKILPRLVFVDVSCVCNARHGAWEWQYIYPLCGAWKKCDSYLFFWTLYLFYKEGSFRQTCLLTIHLFRTNVWGWVNVHRACVGFYLGFSYPYLLTSHFANKGLASFVVDCILKLKAFHWYIFKGFTGMGCERMYLCVHV